MQSDRTITINLSTGTEVDVILTREPTSYDMVPECGWNLIDSDVDVSGLTEAEIIEAEEQADILREKWREELEDGEDSDDEDEDKEEWDE